MHGTYGGQGKAAGHHHPYRRLCCLLFGCAVSRVGQLVSHRTMFRRQRAPVGGLTTAEAQTSQTWGIPKRGNP
jgi:hypothetical protein